MAEPVASSDYGFSDGGMRSSDWLSRRIGGESEVAARVLLAGESNTWIAPKPCVGKQEAALIGLLGINQIHLMGFWNGCGS